MEFISKIQKTKIEIGFLEFWLSYDKVLGKISTVSEPTINIHQKTLLST